MNFRVDLDERVIATLPFGIVIQNPRGEIVLANPAAEHILGLTTAQMQGRTSVDPRWQATREDGSPFPGTEHPSMVSLRTGQAVKDVVMRVFNPTRDMQRWINVNAAPIRDAEDRVTAVYAVFEDITDKKLAEQALRDSALRYRTLVEGMAEGVAVHELVLDDAGIPIDYQLLDVNPSYEKILGKG